MDIIEKIKEKPELKGLPHSIISESLKNYLMINKIDFEKTSNKDKKFIIKEVRKELRKLTGRFQKSIKSKEKIFSNQDFSKLMKTHSSTAERIDFYPKLREKINSLNIKSILDLGCGINPIALASPKEKYFASDIKEDELLLIKEYFKKNNIKGKVFFYDLRKFDKNNLPKSDICIIFKVLDIIDDKKHNLSEKIILNLKCKYILISLATKKLSGKPMNFPKRYWFENLIKRNFLQFEKFSTKNEVFYLIKK